MAAGKQREGIAGIVWGHYPSYEDPTYNLLMEHKHGPLADSDMSYMPPRHGSHSLWDYPRKNIIYNACPFGVLLYGFSGEQWINKEEANCHNKILYAVYDVGDSKSLDFALDIITRKTFLEDKGSKAQRTLRPAVLIGYAPPGTDRSNPAIVQREAYAREQAEELHVPYMPVTAISHFKSEGFNEAIIAGVDRYFEIHPEEKPTPQAESQTNSNWNLFGFLNNPYMVRAAAPTAIGIPVGAITWAILNALGKNVTLFDTVGHSIGIGAGAGLAIGLMLMVIKCGQGACKDDHPYQHVSQEVN